MPKSLEISKQSYSSYKAIKSERVFSNSSLNIPVAAGDYIEIKAVNPTWGNKPADINIWRLHIH